MNVVKEREKPASRDWVSLYMPNVAAAVVYIFFGAFMAWGINALWKQEKTPITGSFKEQMMHRKTHAMSLISEALVRGDMKEVADSAQQMREVGEALEWYLSSPLYENNSGVFRDSTLELLSAARARDHSAAKESALILKRSCIECHALIHREQPVKLDDKLQPDNFVEEQP